MHVLCMIPTMAGPGGAERTMSYLVNDLVKRHAVTLLTLDGPDARSFYPLSGSLPVSYTHLTLPTTPYV